MGDAADAAVHHDKNAVVVCSVEETAEGFAPGRALTTRLDGEHASHLASSLHNVHLGREGADE